MVSFTAGLDHRDLKWRAKSVPLLELSRVKGQVGGSILGSPVKGYNQDLK